MMKMLEKCLLAIIIFCVSCYASMDADSISQPECVNRFEYRHELKERWFKSCEELYKDNPYCKKNYTVAYSDFPPYIFYDEHKKKINGILPGMLEFAMESCCFGCNEVTYHGPYEHIERFFQQNASFAMPVQTADISDKYFGHDYINMLSISSVSFFSHPVKPDPVKIGESMALAILNTWPMLIFIAILSISAGFCVWILDFTWNSNEFPSKFPTGPIEGCWWAFISMTTVGYGDKCPRGPFARIFAVIWILIGITVFSTYTATLTSAMNSSVMNSQDISLTHKRFGILNTTSAGMIACIQVNAKPVPFETLSEIANAYKLNQIEGLILDDYMANFFMDQLAEYGVQDLTLHHRAIVHDISFGMVAMHEDDKTMLGSFFKSNNDNRELMAKLSLQGHDHRKSIGKATDEVNEFYTTNSPMYIGTIVTFVCITVVLTIFGLTFSRIKEYFRSKAVDKHTDLELLESKNYDMSYLANSMDDLRQKINQLLQQQNIDHKMGNHLT